MKSARLLIATASLFLCGGIGHWVGGAHIASSISQLTFLTVIIACVAFLMKNELGGPSLATAILLSQLSTHILLGSSAGSDLRMLSSHTIFGFASYLMATRIERTLASFIRTIEYLFAIFLPHFESIKLNVEDGSLRIQERKYIFNSLDAKQGLQLRAPPLN
jgi:hypothetical protein